MRTHDVLAERIWAIAYLTGSFRLRSGAESNEYFDKYRFESEPSLLRDICTALLPLIPPQTEVLAGLELGGVPIATVLGQLSGLPVVFVRKAPKDYGTCRLAEGTEVASRRVVIVEDVITSGGQVIESAASLRELGATIDHVLCVVDRQAGGMQALADRGIQLTPLFTLDALRLRDGAAASGRSHADRSS